MRITITPIVKINTADIAKKIHEAAKESVSAVSTQILKDSNYYAPRRGDGLVDSSIIAANATEAFSEIKWDVPYASYVYKGLSKKGKPLKYNKERNPNAQKEWCKKAKSVHLKDWNEMVENIMKRRFGEKQ